MAADVIDAAWLAFLASRRTATLATLSAGGQPRLVPICFVVEDGGEGAPIVLWSPLDAKPKREADVRRLARVRDIAARPEATLLFERWSEDWSRLAWLRARGLATLVEAPDDAAAHGRAVDDAAAHGRAVDDAAAHGRAVEALRAKYPQYGTQDIEIRPMIRILLTEATGWSAMPEGLAEPD